MAEYDKEEVQKKWQATQDNYNELYLQGEEDWEFLHGINQWDERDVHSRQKDGRPCLTLNQMLPYAQQIINDIRQTRLSIRISPVDGEADVDTAETLAGIIRNIERQSKANNAYNMAAINAIGAGLGWIRINTEYSDPMSFDQEITIDRVLDFISVYLDLMSEKLDGSDAEYAFIRTDYTKEEFEEVYPDADPISFDSKSSKNEVCVMEYFEKCYKTKTIYRISLAGGTEQIIDSDQKKKIDDNNELAEEEGAIENILAYTVLEERETKIPYVNHYVLNGSDEPIDEEEFPSKFIPVVPVYGNEVYLDGKREFHSLIRQAKDAQKMYNYWKSASTEFIALQPKAPYVGAKGSFKTQGKKWAAANRINFTTLEYDVVKLPDGGYAPPPQRQAPITGSPAMMQEAIGAREDIRLGLGMPQANMGEQGNEVSGIAIRNRQIEGDNATFHFVDNLAAAITQVGCILVDMIPRLYSERKIARILGEDGKEEIVPINQPFVKDQGAIRPMRQGDMKMDGVYNLGVGKYDVVCDVGASYSSKRQETADKLIELVRARPDIAEVTGDLLFEALDLPMGKEIASRIKATMPPNMLGDDPEAARLQEAAAVVQDLQEKLANYEAALADKRKNAEFEQMTELKKLEMDSRELDIKAQKTAAEIEKMRAETTGFNMEAIAALGEAVNGMNAQMADMSQALEIILMDDEEMDEPLIESPITQEDNK